MGQARGSGWGRIWIDGAAASRAGARRPAELQGVLSGALLSLVTATIGWCATWLGLPQAKVTPGFEGFILTFAAGVALPYALAAAAVGLRRSAGEAAARNPLRSDVPRAVALYERACRCGAPHACFFAAQSLAVGDGVEQDVTKALGLFAGLCRGGSGIACSRAGDLAPAQRADCLRRGCALGDRDACRRSC